MILASIGSTHPRDVAGVAVDARVAADYGMSHASVIVGVTAQNGKTKLHAVPAGMVRAQLAALPAADAYRIGALVSPENVDTVGEFLHLKRVPVVVDPVLYASDGAPLFESSEYAGALRELVRLPVLVTPNIREASILCEFPVESLEEMRKAAQTLVDRGAAGVLVKGGHLEADPADVFVDANISQVFTGSRLPGSLRGTGCRLAAALACELALGSDIAAAIESARQYVRSAIEKS